MPKIISAEKIAAAKAADPGREFLIPVDNRTGDEYLFRVPGRAEYEAFQAMAFEDKTRPQAMRTLLDRCAVDPTPAELSVILDRQPGLAGSFGTPLLEACGQGISVTVKKA